MGFKVCTRTDIPEREIPDDAKFELSLGGAATRLYAKSHLAYGLFCVVSMHGVLCVARLDTVQSRHVRT